LSLALHSLLSLQCGQFVHLSNFAKRQTHTEITENAAKENDSKRHSEAKNQDSGIKLSEFCLNFNSELFLLGIKFLQLFFLRCISKLQKT